METCIKSTILLFALVIVIAFLVSRLVTAQTLTALHPLSGSGGPEATGSERSTAEKSEYPGCPPPVMPEEAFFLSEYLRLTLTLTADREGNVLNVVISTPSRAKLYDEYTRKWVANHWKMPHAKPGEPELRTFIAPIVYPKREKPPGGHYPTPDYPLGFQQSGTEGLVVVDMIVAPSGKVESARTILSSGHKGLDDYTVKWVLKKWSFAPGQKRLVRWPVAYLLTKRPFRGGFPN